MPEGGGGSCEVSAWHRDRCRKMQGVERPETIAPGESGLGTQILHREAKRVKLNGTVVINGELSNGDKILNNIRSNKNVNMKKRTG
jgi:hypothetical protein